MTASRFYSSVAGQMFTTGSLSNSATSVTVDTVAGLPSSYPYTIILDPALSSEEICTVTGAGGTTLTITRGVDGSSAVSHLSGAEVRHGYSARDFQDSRDHEALGDTAHGGNPVYATFSKGGTLVTGTGTFKVYNPSGRTLTITEVRASVGTAPTGATIIVDVHKSGTTIYTTQSNRPAIAISGVTATGGTPDLTWGTSDYLTVDIDQVGSTVAGADLTVQITAR